jgi:hypothetical protein
MPSLAIVQVSRRENGKAFMHRGRKCGMVDSLLAVTCIGPFSPMAEADLGRCGESYIVMGRESAVRYAVDDVLRAKRARLDLIYVAPSPGTASPATFHSLPNNDLDLELQDLNYSLHV